MISTLNQDCASGRSPCFKCEKHKKGFNKLSCSTNCQKILDYRGLPEPVFRADDRKIYTRKIPVERKKCCVPGCNDVARTWKMCHVHYGKWKHGATLVKHPFTGKKYTDRNIKNIKNICSMDGCETEARAWKLCRKHYAQWVRGTQIVKHPTTLKIYSERNELTNHEPRAVL